MGAAYRLLGLATAIGFGASKLVVVSSRSSEKGFSSSVLRPDWRVSSSVIATDVMAAEAEVGDGGAVNIGSIEENGCLWICDNADVEASGASRDLACGEGDGAVDPGAS